MDLFVLCVACLTVFVNGLVKHFAICLGVVVILLFSVVGDALLDRPLLSSEECVCCSCDTSVHLNSPSICLFEFLYVRGYLLI